MRALACLIACACACAEQAPPPATSPPAQRAFYYWRTTFRLTAAERSALADLHVGRLYVRAFDIVWDDAAAAPAEVAPLAPPSDGVGLPGGLAIVPVVFVRAGIFAPGHLAAAAIPAAAATTWRGVQGRFAALGVTPHELQVDCDWTDTTQAGYFAFLRALAVAAGPQVTLTATIRLHQIKYRERTGVPPVARGTLMFYNMGRFSADPDARAIFDARSATRYLARIPSYPLPLDVALPIWSWTMHLRDGIVIGLLQSTDPDELADLDFLRRSGVDRYEVTRTTYLHGTLLAEGDVLKVEITGEAEAQAAAELVAPALPPDPARTVTLFDLSERNLGHHSGASLARLFDAVH